MHATQLHQEYLDAGLPISGVNADGYPNFDLVVQKQEEDPAGGGMRTFTGVTQIHFTEWDGDKALVEQILAAHLAAHADE